MEADPACPDAQQPIDFPDKVAELRVLYPEVGHWSDGMIETWWSEYETGLGVKRSEPHRSEIALALALHDHLFPGQDAFDSMFDDTFFQSVHEVFSAAQIGVTRE